MHRYLVQRLALVVFVLLGVTLLVFLVTRLTPGDPARVLLGPRATDDQVARLRASYGLDEPLYVQYVAWLGHVVRGELGDSIQLHRPVANEVAERFRATLILAASAMVVAFGLGLLFGVVGALRAHTVLDRVLTSMLLVGISLPPFWVGLILIIVFTLVLRWLPATGMLSATGGGPFDLLSHLVLPTITLAVVPLAVIARLTRANVLEVLGQLYVRTAHAKGLPPARVVLRHVLSNTLVGTVTILGLEAGWLLAGTVYIETVFAWPGLGSMLVNAILQRDYPLVQGGVLGAVAGVYVIINLATDTLYLYLDAPGCGMVDLAAPAVALPPARVSVPAGGRRRRSWLAQRPMLAFGLAVVILIVLVAVLAPLLPLRDPNATAPARRLGIPGASGYLLGTDQLGRDLLSRLIWGARVSMAVAGIAAAVAFVFGGAIGLLAGYYGKAIDNVLMRLIDVLMAFPYVLLAIALVAALGPGLLNALIAIAVVNISFYARGVRAATLVVRRMAFIEAARTLGATDRRVLLREVVPNIAAPLLVFITLNIGTLIVETAGLSFIGLGAQPPTADWGTMLADGRQFMMTAPHVAAIPGVAVLALVWGLNMLGDGLRDLLDPTLAHATR